MKKRNLREILIQLLEKKHFLTAPEILEFLAKKGTTVNKTSVYRNLEKMLTENQVCRHSFGSDKVYYELRSLENEHHDHFVCELCKKIDHLECMIDRSKLPEGYTLKHHHVTLFGICDACSRNATH